MTIVKKLRMLRLLSAGTVLVFFFLFVLLFTMQGRAQQRMTAADSIKHNSSLINILTSRYLMHREESMRLQWIATYNALEKVLKGMPAREEETPVVKRMLGNLAGMKALFADIVTAFRQGRAGSASRPADALIMRSGDVSMDASRLVALSDREIRTVNRKVVVIFSGFSVLLAVAVLLSSSALGSRITGPINRLRDGAEIIGSGNLDYRIEIRSDDEIGRLSEAFDNMTARLKTITVSRDELAREVAERKRAEEALNQNRRFLEAIIQNAPACIKLVAEDGSVIQMNQAGLRILEADSPEQVQGGNISSCISFKYQPAFMSLIKEVFQGKSGTLEFEAASLKGKPLWLSTRAVPLYDNAGAVTALLGITVDITDRKRDEDRLKVLLTEVQRSNGELEQFAYVASHDLQEPLRMVSGFVGLLERKYRGRLDAKADEYIRFALDGTNRMQKLIEGLLAYSRVSTRAREFSAVDLNKVFQDAVSNLQVAIREGKATVTGQKLPTVKGDETQLLQVLQNLIGNGVKFRKTDVPPEVQVSARREESEWLFQVRDNGIGIEKKDLDRVFQVFQRLHTREEYPGTGIGLAVCKKIVERHGGRIWAESVPGEGTSFFFTMPLSA